MILTEQQVRQVIREEIEQYLLEEGIMDLRTGPFRKLFLPAVAIAMFSNAAQPQIQASAGSSPPIEQQVQSIEELIDEAGMTDELLNQLNSELTEEDQIKLNSLFVQIKQKQQEINDAKKANKSDEVIKQLEKEKNDVFTAKNFDDPKQLDRILATGRAIIKYIESVDPDVLASFDLSTPEGKTKLKAKALQYSLSSKGRSTLLANNVTQDLINAKNYVLEKDPSIPQTIDSGSFFKIVLAYVLGTYGNEAAERFGDVITPIELIQFLHEQPNEQFQSELFKNFKTNLIDEYSLGLEDDPQLSISKDEAFQIMTRVNQQTVQENKVNKLRQRLNELRGVYV
jgi:hypothetical protein